MFSDFLFWFLLWPYGLFKSVLFHLQLFWGFFFRYFYFWFLILFHIGQKTYFIRFESFKFIEIFGGLTISSVLINVPCALKKKCIFCCHGVECFINFNFVKLFDSVFQYCIFANFLFTCSITYWEMDIKISDYNEGLHLFILRVLSVLLLVKMCY